MKFGKLIPGVLLGRLPRVACLLAWVFFPHIGQGANGPDDGKVARVRSEHWSLQALKAPAVPVITNQPGGSISVLTTRSPVPNTSNPIDRFITARLVTNGLALSPEADRATLIRRLSFDLVGLPPSPQQLDEFVQSKSPRAYEELIERLLASPHYGERWGRHWLDVARYTESQGFEYDRLRTNAWPYRDYVIKSFNDDKPYDQFMKEQIAGDVLEPVTSDGIIGASLLVCGPWDQAGNGQANATQKAITREEELEDTLSVVGQTFLGLTINCARCHAHKYDPIPHEEYYRIKSVFEGVKHGERSIATPAESKAREVQIASLKKEIAVNKEQLAQIPQPEILASLTPEQRAAHEAASARLKRFQEALEAVKPLPVAYAGTRVQPAPTKRLKRGDVTSPDEIVTPGGLSAIVDLNPDFGLAADAPEAQRRLRFAEWVADPRNPLPARVMANRVWHYHFGQGLVTTPNDFGVNGARPSHPELLDWLAIQFIKSGWSVKALHRLILNSATYRQASIPNAKAAAIDGDNQLLWRFPPRRLEAEILRDAMLAVSGQINLHIGGPSFRPFTVSSFNSDFYTPKDMTGPDYNRRTVYRMNVNSGKDPLLDAFDCPDPSVKTPRRGVTTTPLQALALMNNSFVQRQAAQLAERAMKEANDVLPAAIQSAYRLALGRAATPEESTRAAAAAKERGLSHVCWALLNSTEFVYVK